MTQVIHAVYGLSLALWVGGISMFTFLMTPILFRTLGRDEAGRIVGLFFPAYFGYNLVVGAIALAGFLLARRVQWRFLHWATLVLLVVGLSISAYVRFSLYPRAEAVKRTIASFETVPREDPARREFSRLHGTSMALNLVLLLDGLLLLLSAPALLKD